MIVSSASIGITLASAGGFWLMAIAWPAVIIAASIAWAFFFIMIVMIWLRNRRKKRAESTADIPEDNAIDAQ